MAIDEVGLQNLVDVFFGLVGVPNAFGVNNQYRPEFAAIEAARLVDAHAVNLHFADTGLHVVAQLDTATLLAAASAVARRTLVDATKNVCIIVRP